jgi:hypothetical protein
VKSSRGWTPPTEFESQLIREKYEEQKRADDWKEIALTLFALIVIVILVYCFGWPVSDDMR